MISIVGRAQVPVGYMGVDLRSRDITVTEQCLDGSGIRSMLK